MTWQSGKGNTTIHQPDRSRPSQPGATKIYVDTYMHTYLFALHNEASFRRRTRDVGIAKNRSIMKGISQPQSVSDFFQSTTVLSYAQILEIRG